MKACRITWMALAMIATIALSSTAGAAMAREVKIKKTPVMVESTGVQIDQCKSALNLTAGQKTDFDVMKNLIEDPYCCADFADNAKRIGCLSDNIATANEFNIDFYKILQTAAGDNVMPQAAPCFGSSSTSVDTNVENLKDCLKKANRNLNNFLKKLGYDS